MKFPTTFLPENMIKTKIIGRFASKTFASLPFVLSRLPEPPLFIQKLLIEKTLNRALSEQISIGDFDFLEGHCLHLCITDMKLDFYLSQEPLQGQSKLVLKPKETLVDVHFTGNSHDLLLLASRAEDPDTFFFQRRLIIEGDTELGLNIKNIIDSVDFDEWPNWLNSLLSTLAQHSIEIKNSNITPLNQTAN